MHEKAQQLQQLLSVVPQYGNMDSKLWLHKWLALQSEDALKWRAFLRVHTEGFQLKQFELNESLVNEELKTALEKLQAVLKERQEQFISDALQIDIDLAEVKQQLSAAKDEDDEHVVDLNASELKIYQLLLPALREYFMDRVLSSTINVDFDERLNQEYSEQLITLNGHLWKCLNTLQSAEHDKIMSAWRAVSNVELEQLEGSGCYKALRSYQRQYRYELQCYQLDNLATRFDCAQVPTETELSSRYSYQGPALTNVLLALICHPNGQLLSVPLSDLQPWRQSLQQTRQLIWQNAQLVSRRHSSEVNNLQLAQQEATQLLQELKYLAEVKQQPQMDSGFQSCLRELQQVLQQLQATDKQNESVNHVFDGALATLLIGALELSLLTHAPLIDPVEKNRLKNLYISEDIDCLQHLSTVYDFMKIIMKYKHFGQQIYEQVQQQLQLARQQQQQLNQRLALRPEECMYAALVQDLTHFLKSNCDCSALHKIITGIREHWQHFVGPQLANATQLKSGSELLNKLELWLANAQRFVQHTLSRYSAYYQDFVLPIKCAVNQMRFGLEQMKVLFTRLLAAGSVPEALRLEHTVNQMVQFPSQRPLSIRSNHVYALLAKLPHCEHDYFRLLKAKLSELRNFITIASTIDETIFAAYDDALHICNQTWQQEEKRRNEKRAEEESLYKTKTLGGIEDEELVELQEIEQNFPTHLDEDFAEFVDQPTLEQVLKLDKKASTKAKLAEIVNEQDYVFLARNFIEVMSNHTRVSYKEPVQHQQKEELQLIAPYQARLQVFVQLHAHYKTALSSQLDDSVYNGLAFALALQQRQLKDIELEDQHSKQTYDYYKDSNIGEVNGCLNVMERIEKRVLEQLELYPEHAGLADIKLVISRIRKLPANACVVRFNTGFQLLRQKLALWNEVAHRNNNLQVEEIEVAEFVQRWTKLELQHWRNCLQQTAQQVELKAYRYWFFIYNLLQAAGGELPELIRTLRQFVEASSYGDFHVRLQLLHGFEMYLHNADRGGKKSVVELQPLIAALHNLQLYFSQFSQEVADTVKSRRAPIEKKLREFVKIQSYNKDLSYFSMRNNVANVHRNLNKFLKEYRLLLEQKISEVFQPKDGTVKDYNVEKLKVKNKPLPFLMDARHFVASEQLRDKYKAQDLGENAPLLQRLGKHFGTARNIVRETISQTGYGFLISEMDELVDLQLERCEHLRNLNVDRSKERPQQKLQAKQILQQKRKALTDLFKVLSRLGLNYKTGLMELSLRTEFENFQLPPFSIAAMLPSLHASWRQLNRSMDLYYMKSVFKLKLLQNIMLTPLSELGPPNIERIKGFAVDMFLLVQQQREQLSSSTRELHELRQALDQLRQVADIVLPEQATVEQLSFSHNADQCLQLKHKLCQIQYVIRQWQLLLHCAPAQEQSENSVLLTRLPLRLAELLELCGQILRGSQVLLQELERANLEYLDSNKLQQYQRNYQQIVDNIRQALAHLDAGHDEHLPLAQPLLTLLDTVEKTAENANSIAQAPIELTNVDAELTNIAHGVLLALQKIYKQHGKHEKVDEEDKKEDNDELKEQHLKQHLTGQLDLDWQHLSLARTLSKLSNVLLVLKHAEPSEEKLHCLRRSVTLLPVLEQYQLLADYLLLQQLGTHKTSAKMLSIMLTAFVEIGSKGFCVPPDLMQDEEGQSKQDSKNGEGFGLEDGTGENDASDKIESEDQLDDAKRPEDRKDEGDKEEPDCKEEKGIDMSDDFDAKMQDVDKPEEDDSGESEEEDELNKEMGETEEGAEKLDDQIWGDDEEKQPEEEEEPEMKEEDQGKGSKDEKDEHNDLDTKNDAAKEDGKDEHEKDGLDATSEPSGEDKRKEQAKDIDDMKEPELDEEQTNAMHNELEEPPEPEEMDLGDMNNVDEGHDNDGDDQNEENPFDIDAMKENMQPAEEAEEDAGDEAPQEDQPQSDSSDSEDEEGATERDPTQNGKDEAEDEEAAAEEEKENKEPETQTRGELEHEEEAPEEKPAEPEAREEKPEEHTQSKDKSSKEENVQSVPDTEQNSSADQVQQQQQDEDVKQEQKMDEQETGEEKDGVGQAENDVSPFEMI